MRPSGHVDTVYVLGREKSWEAMAEWVMFDAAFSDVSGIRVLCATFIKMATLGSNGRGYRTRGHARVVKS